MKKHGYIRYAVILLFVVIAVISLILLPMVGINFSISDYLDDSTDTKISLGILEREFGMTGSLNVIIKNTDKETAREIAERIGEIENVLTVAFDPESEVSYKNGNARISVAIDGDDSSEEAKAVYADVKQALDGMEGVSYNGGVAASEALRETIETEMVFILAISLGLVAIILLVTSRSWLEPFVLLFASGFAVVINLGTNIIFGEISYITSSVAAILQLALSIDYSIVMLHTFQSEKLHDPDSSSAMLRAVKKVVKPVSASALTTVAGLFALLFMTFTIGFDIGIVLIKGIVISAMTALTLLPALVLALERPMNKLKKKEFIPKGELFCKLSFKCGKIITPIAVLVVIGCMLLQSFNTFSFTEVPETDNAGFGNNSTVLIVYKKGENDHESERKFAERLYQLKSSDGSSPVNTFTAHSNTVREEYTVDKAVSALGVEKTDAEMLFALYHLEADPSRLTLTSDQLAHYISVLLKNDADVASLIDPSAAEAVDMMLNIAELMDSENTAEEFHTAITQLGADISYDNIRTIYNRYGKSSAKGREIVAYALDKYSIIINAEAEAQLRDMLTLDAFFSDEQKYDYISMTKKINGTVKSIESIDADISLDTDILSGGYIKYAIANAVPLNEPVEAADLVGFAVEAAETNGLMKMMLTDDMKVMLTEAQTMISEAEEMFIGDRYSRMLLTVDLPNEGKDTTDFVKSVSAVTEEIFGQDSYVAGEIASNYDLQTAFEGDNTFISIFTVVSVFIIVMLIFRSLSLPIILVAVIQGAIWIAFSVWLALGETVFFMSYIMTSCILMGATIDYGILMSSNYVSYRKTLDKKDALKLSVDAAMPTVFSSGTVMTVCGFVIGAIASQRAIASVGTLIGIGTLISVTMITVVLPSALYLLDGFIMRLSIKWK